VIGPIVPPNAIGPTHFIKPESFKSLVITSFDSKWGVCGERVSGRSVLPPDELIWLTLNSLLSLSLHCKRWTKIQC